MSSAAPESLPQIEGEGLLVEPETRWIGQNYAFTRASDGANVGRFRIHIGKPNTFDAPGVHLDLGQDGFLAPRFFAIQRNGLEVAALRHHLLTGALEVETRGDRPRLRAERRGLVLPEVRITTEDGRRVLETKTTKLLGREFAATLHPVPGWPREDLLALLALLFHAKVSLTILYTAVGGTGVLAPI